MDWTFRRIHQQRASNRIPHCSSCHNEPARRSGYMGPDFVEHHPLPHQLRSHQTLDFHDSCNNPLPHPHPFLPYHPRDMYEMIQREIEKDKIRQEIIASEIARRHALEAEVRRELMMERDLALKRGVHGFPFSSYLRSEYYSPSRTEPEDRIVMSTLNDAKTFSVNFDNEGFVALPFVRGAEARNSKDKVVSIAGQEKERIILQPKPVESLPGSKRKSSTPPESDIYNLKKNKAKEDWSCALCQVSSTSKQALEEHLSGKKHKANEVTLRNDKKASKNNYHIGLFPKKSVIMTKNEGMQFKEAASSPVKETEEALKPLQRNQKPEGLKNTDAEEAIQQVEKNGDDQKDRKYRFWCEICKVGTFCEVVMNSHVKGKKHGRRVQKIERKCDVSSCVQKKTKNAFEAGNNTNLSQKIIL